MTNVRNNSGDNDPQIPEFIIKETVSVQGITEDFVWYESEILMRDMAAWSSRFKRLVETMEARHKEHLRIIGSLLAENTKLKKEKNERT